MDKIKRREKLKVQLKDKRYRDAFVSEYIDAGISFQIRALRKREGWTQKKLAEKTGMAQERISVAENPNYSSFNIKTLKRIASAFDVAFIGRFVPISELVDWELNISSETLAPVSFENDPYFQSPVTKFVAQGGYVIVGSGIIDFINPSQPSQAFQSAQANPRDELAKFREAKQIQLRNQLSEHMTGMEKRNETALG